MGFSTWDCKKCGEPILHNGPVTEKNAWMRWGTFILPDGKTFSGMYDGYGRFGGVGRFGGEDVKEHAKWEGDDLLATFYHRACWLTLPEGERGYKGPGVFSPCQGYFCDAKCRGHNKAAPHAEREEPPKKRRKP